MGLSFAIPVNVVQSVVDQLREQGFVSRGWLGVVIQDVDRGLAKSFGMDTPQGALIAKVNAGSPAADAGLKAGDVVIAFNNQPIGVSSDLPPLVGSMRPGQTVDVELLRSREKLTLPVTIRELKETRRSADAAEEVEEKSKMLGLSLQSLSQSELSEYGVDNGLLVFAVDENGVAAAAGIAKGDVLISYNNTTISSLSDLKSLIASSESGQSIALLISRNKNPQFVALTLP